MVENFFPNPYEDIHGELIESSHPEIHRIDRVAFPLLTMYFLSSRSCSSEPPVSFPPSAATDINVEIKASDSLKTSTIWMQAQDTMPNSVIPT